MGTVTLQDKMLALAQLTTECPGDSVVPPPSYGIIHALAHCTQCDNTGRVSLLDPPTPEHPAGKFGLRVKCDGFMVPVGDTKYHEIYPGAPSCQGRRWTFTTDLWAYVWMSGPHLSYIDAVKLGLLVMDGIKTGIDPGQAAFDVVWEALKGVANG